jgi:hypothetical protein
MQSVKILSCKTLKRFPEKRDKRNSVQQQEETKKKRHHALRTEKDEKIELKRKWLCQKKTRNKKTKTQKDQKR